MNRAVKNLTKTTPATTPVATRACTEPAAKSK
jgi:hypothetical protein